MNRKRGVVTGVMYNVYMCAFLKMCFRGLDMQFFTGLLCLALGFVMWVAHEVVVLCEELIQKILPGIVIEREQAVDGYTAIIKEWKNSTNYVLKHSTNYLIIG